MKPSARDTSPEMQAALFRLMRQLPDWKRLGLAFELTQALRSSVLADIQLHYPLASEFEIRRRFIARVLPRKDVIRAYGFDPKQEDVDPY